jgi:hypothetical protein
MYFAVVNPHITSHDLFFAIQLFFNNHLTSQLFLIVLHYNVNSYELAGFFLAIGFQISHVRNTHKRQPQLRPSRTFSMEISSQTVLECKEQGHLEEGQTIMSPYVMLSILSLQ